MEKNNNKPVTVEEYINRQRAAIATNPDCGTSHYNLAVALLGQRNFDEAEQELKVAIHCSPNLAEAYVQLGGICFQRGDLEGCLYYNQQAVNSRAGFSEGYGNLGFIYMQLGDVDKAIYNLEKATRWNPHFVQAWTTLGNAYLIKGMIDESIDANLKAVELMPDFAVAQNNLGIAYLEKGETKSAVKHLDEAKTLGYAVSQEIMDEIERYR